MGLIKKLLGAVLALIVIAGLGWWLLGGLQDVSVESFMLTDLEGIDLDGFTFNGELGIHNPSNAPVPIESITYTATLEETGERVSAGAFDPFTLDANSVTDADISARVDWAPTAELAIDLLTEDEVWMIVEGEAVIGTADISATLPFSDRIDIARYVEQFVPAGDTVRDVTTDVSETTGAGDTLDTVTGSLP